MILLNIGYNFAQIITDISAQQHKQMRQVMYKDHADKKDFKILLISFFGLDFGIYAVDAFMQSQGYFSHIVKFNQLKMPLEFLLNDYFTMPLLKHEIFPENDLENFISLLTDIKPDLIGMSVSSVCYRTAIWLTQNIRKQKDTTIVWGGIHAIVAPEDCIKYADVVCCGEGEYPFYEIAENLRNAKPLSGIKNTWICVNNKVEKNPMRALIENLDDLPYNDRVTKQNRYFIDNGKVIDNFTINAGYALRAYPVMTSRGCIYSCSFCSNSIIKEKYSGLGKYLRRRSVKHVIGELKYAVKYLSIDGIRFWDDIFTYDEKWIDEFCESYPYEIGKPFICYGHPKHTKPRVLEKLYKSGLSLLFIGIQTGSEEINRKLFGREQLNNQILNFSKCAHDLKITISYDLIVDNPYESEQDNWHTSELLLSLPRPYKVLFYSLCFFPKTPLTIAALDASIIRKEDQEQFTSKAINNFFLFTQKSKNSYQMFWNCIKCMSINPYFPKKAVRFIRGRLFFKKRPYLLFLLCRMWLLIFKLTLWKRRPQWLLPVIKDSYLADQIIHPRNKRLYKKDICRYTFFPVKTNDTYNSFFLCTNRIVGVRHKKNVIEGFEVDIIRVNEIDQSKISIWRLRKNIVLTECQSVRFNLKFPELYCNVYGEDIRIPPINIANIISLDHVPYIIRVKIIKRGNFIPFRLNKILVASSSCLIKE